MVVNDDRGSRGLVLGSTAHTDHRNVIPLLNTTLTLTLKPKKSLCLDPVDPEPES